MNLFKFKTVLTFMILLFLMSFGYPVTPDFFNKQHYLFDPDTLHGDPIGLGVWNVRSIPGARGDAVNIVDVEHGWNLMPRYFP